MSITVNLAGWHHTLRNWDFAITENKQYYYSFIQKGKNLQIKNTLFVMCDEYNSQQLFLIELFTTVSNCVCDLKHFKRLVYIWLIALQVT